MSDAFIQALIVFGVIAFVLLIIGTKIVYDDSQREKALRSKELPGENH